MDGEELQKVASAAAAELPGVTFEHRASPNWELYKVKGKVFMLMTDMPGHPVVMGRDHWLGVLDVAVGDQGARDYLAAHDHLLVECGDLATGRDVDTPTDL